jgi:hypothetical protein
MIMRRRLRPALLGLALALALLSPAHRSAAETCTPDSFGDAVDQSAAELRAFSAETQPKLKQRLQALRDHKKWPDAGFETKGLALVHDPKLDEFDVQASELLSKIDALGSPETSDTANIDCANLSDLKAASSELIAVMRAKSAYLIARLDREIGSSPAAAKPAEVAATEPAKPPAPAPTPATPHPAPTAAATPDEMQSADLSPIRKSESAKAESPAPQPTAPESNAHESKAPASESPPAANDKAKTETEKSSSWSTTTAQAVIPPPPLRSTPEPHDLPPAFDPPPPSGNLPGQPYALPPADGSTDDSYDPASANGYTIDEIQEVTRGFFGTISTSLASVIEHAFKKSGRPTGYVLGKEGGGAFLAGLRYGEGTLYLRSGGRKQVYWHGPSIGYDVGAEGSRTLFLIYNLEEPDNLYRSFTGVDGSAYLVGGVGMTLLKGGPVLMAPIRSGLGLRLGASIGYVRFTARPTWNPF